eukprot:NODE_4_length_4679_cov_47.469025_g2_i0.p1 GENE.NODE_4_length_4679_cov_47.469025_g2_i0~~NODE_4_length_4679_cov_47.469025_g2_i0.p1  ORF type:complete len:1498 (-),score=347.16 NODE_4_length_4679_cov_47.469025_g2_i0:25-4518(-)
MADKSTVTLDRNIGGLPVAVLNKVLGDRDLLLDKFVSVKNVKKNEWEDAILLLTDHFVIVVKTNGKILAEFHLSEIRKLESATEDSLVLGEKNSFALKCPNTDEIISHIRVGVAKDFPGFVDDPNLALKLDVKPASRLDVFEKFFPEFDFKNIPVGPCGGLSRTYKSLCEYHNISVREDIIWDTDNILFANSIKDFNFAEIDDIEGKKDVVPLLGALEGNKWFKTLSLKDIKIHSDGHAALAQMLARNTTLEMVELIAFGGSASTFVAIGEALTKNSSIPVHTINVSRNSMGDQGIIAFATGLQSLSFGLSSLNLSSCGFTKKGAMSLGSSLKKNPHLVNTLTTLDVSKNNIGVEGFNTLFDFIAQPNNIKNLDLSDTNANMDSLFGALMRGCSQNLVNLNLAGNRFLKRGTTAQGPFEQFFSSCMSLRRVNLSNTRPPNPYLESVLAKIVGNNFLKDIWLELRDNEFSNLAASLFQSYLPKAKTITTLDLSDNDFGDDGLALLATGLNSNSSIKTLIMDKCFKTRSKLRRRAIQEMVSMISSENCQIEHLSLAHCGLKNDVIDILDAVGSNESITKLNICHNHFSDRGAYALSKAIQINRTVKTLLWDGNSPSLAGYNAFIIAMSRNSTLKFMPLPMLDLTNQMRSSERKTEKIIKKMEEFLQRNQSPNRVIDSSLEYNQGLLLNSAQQEVLDRLALQIKRAQAGLKNETPDTKALASRANVSFEDVETNRSLLAALQEQTQGLLDIQSAEMVDNLRQFVNGFASNMQNKFDETSLNLLQNVSKKFHTFDAKTQDQLQKIIQVGAGSVDRKFLEAVLVTQAFAEIKFKLGEGFTNLASILSNFAFEKLFQDLEEILDEISSLDENGHKRTDSKQVTQDTAPPESVATSALHGDLGLSAQEKKKKNRQSRRVATDDLTSLGNSALASSMSDLLQLDVETKPEGAKNLEHLTKSRPMGMANRRLPTRRPRPTNRPRADSDADTDMPSTLPPKEVPVKSPSSSNIAAKSTSNTNLAEAAPKQEEPVEKPSEPEKEKVPEKEKPKEEKKEPEPEGDRKDSAGKAKKGGFFGKVFGGKDKKKEPKDSAKLKKSKSKETVDKEEPVSAKPAEKQPLAEGPPPEPQSSPPDDLETPAEISPPKTEAPKESTPEPEAVEKSEEPPAQKRDSDDDAHSPKPLPKVASKPKSPGSSQDDLSTLAPPPVARKPVSPSTSSENIAGMAGGPPPVMKRPKTPDQSGEPAPVTEEEPPKPKKKLPPGAMAMPMAMMQQQTAAAAILAAQKKKEKEEKAKEESQEESAAAEKSEESKPEQPKPVIKPRPKSKPEEPKEDEEPKEQDVPKDEKPVEEESSAPESKEPKEEETPKSEPKPEEPEPKKEEDKHEEPKSEEPKTEEPKSEEEPKKEEPKEPAVNTTSKPASKPTTKPDTKPRSRVSDTPPVVPKVASKPKKSSANLEGEAPVPKKRSGSKPEDPDKLPEPVAKPRRPKRVPPKTPDEDKDQGERV